MGRQGLGCAESDWQMVASGHPSLGQTLCSCWSQTQGALMAGWILAGFAQTPAIFRWGNFQANIEKSPEISFEGVQLSNEGGRLQLADAQIRWQP